MVPSPPGPLSLKGRGGTLNSGSDQKGEYGDVEGLTDRLEGLFEAVGVAFDVFGVLVIVGGVLLATLRFTRQQLAAGDTQPMERGAYRRYKVEVGLALLLGLEVLVAADIIKTVALAPNFTSLGVLAALVAIRTFLSWALVLEIEGRWPWQARTAALEGGSAGLGLAQYAIRPDRKEHVHG